MGRPELLADERFHTVASRADHIDLLAEIVTEWTRGTATQEPVRDLSEVSEDEHLIERGMLERIEHRDFGEIALPNSPLRLADHERIPLRQSPELGEHTREVLADVLGLDAARIAELLAEGVIAEPASANWSTCSWVIVAQSVQPSMVSAQRTAGSVCLTDETSWWSV